MSAPLPPNESARLEALRQYRILDTEAEEAFDDITCLASFICDTPVSFVTFVDEHRQWMKSKVGSEITETPRDIAFCAHTILGPEILIIPDARADPRFAGSPLVTEHEHFRFYAGAPVETRDGHRLGAVCVLDKKRRTLSTRQKEALRALSRQVMARLDMRRVTDALAQALEEVRTVQGLLPICVYCKGIRDDKGYWNAVEKFVSAHTAAEFTHAMCPACAEEHFPEAASKGGGASEASLP